MSSKTVLRSLGYERYVIDSKLSYLKPIQTKSHQSFADEISHGLKQEPKSINPKFFYDEKGSELFEKICRLPEYYLTRTEIEILKKLNKDFTEHFSDEIRLIELGSGSSNKTRLLLDILDSFQDKIEYFPIDISEIIKESSKELQEDYDNLHITSIIDTYERGLEFIKNFDSGQNLIAFLGSSFGNFSPAEGLEFLHKINSTMKEGDLFLIGLDLIKEKKILEDAYDDSQSVTAQFNLNVLSRINNELDGDFDLSNFVHHAKYNEEKQRIEMYLRSVEKQSVSIHKANLSLNFEKDELIHTENSYKYSIPQIKQMLHSTNFKIHNIWQDQNQHYVLVLASKLE